MDSIGELKRAKKVSRDEVKGIKREEVRILTHVEKSGRLKR